MLPFRACGPFGAFLLHNFLASSSEARSYDENCIFFTCRTRSIYSVVGNGKLIRPPDHGMINPRTCNRLTLTLAQSRLRCNGCQEKLNRRRSHREPIVDYTVFIISGIECIVLEDVLWPCQPQSEANLRKRPCNASDHVTRGIAPDDAQCEAESGERVDGGPPPLALRENTRAIFIARLCAASIVPGV